MDLGNLAAMRRMDWDTRKPGKVSRRATLSKESHAYVYKHNDDGINHNDSRGAPKEQFVLRGNVSHLSGAENA